MDSGSARRAPLDTPTIVAAAVALADDEGVDALSMRRLADRLGFKVMALYHHVAHKDDLLGLMVDAVAGTIQIPDLSAPPVHRIRSLAVATREAFVRHPWVPMLWQRHLPGPERIDHMEALLLAFADSDLSPDLAHHGFHAVNNHVLGYTLQEHTMGPSGSEDVSVVIEGFLSSLSPETHPHTIAHVQQHLDGDTERSFELVLDLILDGLLSLEAARRT